MAAPGYESVVRVQSSNSGGRVDDEHRDEQAQDCEDEEDDCRDDTCPQCADRIE
jgi:hypothetical protein